MVYIATTIVIFSLLALLVVINMLTLFELQWVRDQLELYHVRKVGEIADKPVQYTDNSEETPEEPVDLFDEQSLTEGEIARIHREQEFDQRIKAMKEELAFRTPDVPRKGSEAMQLHPHVHNLPHNIISDFYDDLPDVEESI